MLSRRNIRVKVMQAFYMLHSDKQLTYQQAHTRYRKSIDNAYEMYLFNLLMIGKIANYAEHVAAKKAAKLAPTEEDKRFRPILSTNPLVRSINENEGLTRLAKKRAITARIQLDDYRRFYQEFSKKDKYRAYLKEAQTNRSHLDILLELYKMLVGSEDFNDLMEQQYAEWLDDKSLVVGAVKKTLKSLPATGDFYEIHRPTEETIIDFGEILLHKVHHENDELLELIKPTLNNWDVDRVAIIDMILLKMALCELLNFPTIPTKVTLNEFVEISKLYSTDKSKDFINGILDRLMKDLNKKGLIKKEGRGLIG